jgi:hypothetical protein
MFGTQSSGLPPKRNGHSERQSYEVREISTIIQGCYMNRLHLDTSKIQRRVYIITSFTNHGKPLTTHHIEPHLAKFEAELIPSTTVRY